MADEGGQQGGGVDVGETCRDVRPDSALYDALGSFYFTLKTWGAPGDFEAQEILEVRF